MIKIDANLIELKKNEAKSSQRLRTNFNFHKTYNDPIQRLLNVMNKESYICPHKHENPDKREVFLLLEGKAVVIVFNSDGTPDNWVLLDPKTRNYGIEIPAKTFHTIIPIENSVCYEIKDGPYDVSNDKNFAPWAPKENEKGAHKYNLNLLQQIGITF